MVERQWTGIDETGENEMSYSASDLATMTPDQLAALVAKMQAENSVLKASVRTSPYKITDNGLGYVSVNTGIGPGSLLGGTITAWKAFLDQDKGQLAKFIETHGPRVLSEHAAYAPLSKEQKAAVKAAMAAQKAEEA